MSGLDDFFAKKTKTKGKPKAIKPSDIDAQYDALEAQSNAEVKRTPSEVRA